MTRYSLSTLFKEHMKNPRMDEKDQRTAIKMAHNVARWIGDMPKYNCSAKVINLQIGAGSRIRLILKYRGDKDVLVAKKIIFK